MDQVTNYFRIDISKDVLDVYVAHDRHHKLENNASGFSKLEELMKNQAHLVKETTGCYHQQFA